MKALRPLLRAVVCCLLSLVSCPLSAQTTGYTDADEWKAYDDFNTVFLDVRKNIYKDYSDRANATDRWNGAAAIWCQAIFFDMAVDAYRRAQAEDNAVLSSRYKLLVQRLYSGEKNHYANFNFHDCNENTGWFIYDDIMWWTCALARAFDVFGTAGYLTQAELSFLRVWYGSATVGDDGSYADPSRGLGGGMFWEWQPIHSPQPHKAGDFRSACINFPTVIAACRLSQLVPENRTAPTAERPTQQTREWYLEKAIEVYEWASSTLVSQGRVADGIHGGPAEFHDHLYNQATYIGASCLLYKITGQNRYLLNARQAADYVFNTMCSGNILPLETGIEQGIYCAIFAQYLAMLVYDCHQTKYLAYVKRNIERGWQRRDTERGISNGDFARGETTSAERVESYAASALPALMLMFPVGDSQTGIGQQTTDDGQPATATVCDLAGRAVVESRAKGAHKRILIRNRRKVLQ